MTDETTPQTDRITSLARQAEIQTKKVIVTADRLRPVKAHRVEVLRQDISFNGLLQPILVQENDLGYMLVDGLQRLEAMKKLNFVTLDAYVLPRDMAPEMVRYCQIMANINREDMTKLERAEYIADLDATWKALNPSARHGGDRRSAALRAVKERDASDDEGAVLGLSADVAEKTCLSRRAFFQCLEIAKGLIPSVKTKVQSLHFENNHTFLLKLSQQPADQQEAIIDLLLDENSEAKTIDEALLLLAGRRIQPAKEKLLGRSVATWGRMSRADREVFCDTFKDDILTIARAKGWI